MGDQPKGGLFQFRKQSHSREKNAQIRLEENVQDQGLKKIVHRPSTNLSQQILVRGVRQSQRNLKNMKLKGSNLDLSASKTSASSSKIILQGWLIKRGGGGFKNWKKRWFVLKDDEISYYKSSDDHLDWNSVPDERMLVLMGVLKLKGARVIDYLEEKVGFNISSPIGDGILIQKPAITTGNGASPASSYFSRKSIKKNFMFGIETSDRNLLVKSHEEGEKTKWMNAIRDTIIKETFGPGLSLDRSASGVIDEKIKSLEISPSLIEKSESRSLSFKNLSADSAGDWEVPFSALEFENLLAEGNYGSVFKGRMWGTTVALKTLKIDVNQQEKILSDLQNEVQILSRLRHPNVVLYIGASTKLPDICIVTEWCEKGNLHDILYEDKYNIDFMLMIKFALDIAQGMNYLHSLDSQIIHRDLKSQNIIMDSNFNAKVADFGLSFKSTNDPSLTNRRDSRAEKYGVFGTPEWMAPEVMKGEPYNQTIDVYSYGVLLCEILSRTKPYSDKYTIRDYNDICDIVLDEEAIPTIPKWSGKQLEDLILKCFSRTPSNRPSFSSIIATLRAITMGSPERVYFAEFDIPRIMDGLHNQNEFLNEVVCSEIASFFQQSNSDSYCKRCGYSPSKLDIPSLIENSTLTRMALRIISYFSSKNEKLLEKSTHAFAQLLRVSGGDRISHFRSALREDGGLRRLLVYLNSTNQIIKQSASDIMIRLTNDLSSEEQAKFVDLSFLGLSSVAALSQGQRGLDRLQTVVDDELLEYKKRREELEILIAQKEKFSLTVANSREILHSKFEKESASSIRRGTLHRKEDVEILKKFQLMKKQGLELNESVLNSELNPERISASSVGDTNSEIPLTSNHCPEAFLEYFGDFKRIQFINALRWNEESFFWEPCFLFLFGHELRIYVAIDNEPDDPLFLLDLSAKENPDDPSSSPLPLVFIQDVFGKINCIKVIVQDSEFIFAFRKARDCKKWAHIINPCSFEDIAEAQASDSLEILSPLAEYSSVLEKQLSQESDYSDALLKIRNPPTAFLSENFKEYFEGMEISIYGYLCFKDIVADEWTVKFCILVNGVFRMFQSHEDEADDCQLLIYLSSTTQSEFAVPKTTDSTNTQLSGWNQQAFAVKDDASFYLFCAASTEDRERWIQAFAPNIVIQ